MNGKNLKIIGGALVVLFGLVASIWGLPKVFVTVDTMTIKEDTQTKDLMREITDNRQEIAGVSAQQQYYFSAQEIKRLKREIRQIRKKYGSNVTNMPPEIQAIYLELLDDLKLEQDNAKRFKSKMK